MTCKHFLPFCRLSFYFLDGTNLRIRGFYSFWSSSIYFFGCCCCASCFLAKKSRLNLIAKILSFNLHFIDMAHFELIFVYGVRKGHNFPANVWHPVVMATYVKNLFSWHTCGKPIDHKNMVYFWNLNSHHKTSVNVFKNSFSPAWKALFH